MNPNIKRKYIIKGNFILIIIMDEAILSETNSRSLYKRVFSKRMSNNESDRLPSVLTNIKKYDKLHASKRLLPFLPPNSLLPSIMPMRHIARGFPSMKRVSISKRISVYKKNDDNAKNNTNIINTLDEKIICELKKPITIFNEYWHNPKNTPLIIKKKKHTNVNKLDIMGRNVNIDTNFHSATCEIQKKNDNTLCRHIFKNRKILELLYDSTIG